MWIIFLVHKSHGMSFYVFLKIVGGGGGVGGGWGGGGKGVVYLTSTGRPTDIGLQLGKACWPCSR